MHAKKGISMFEKISSQILNHPKFITLTLVVKKEELILLMYELKSVSRLPLPLLVLPSSFKDGMIKYVDDGKRYRWRERGARERPIG
jgi:hypothetical protein